MRSIVFMFPGQGAQHVNMGRALYEHAPVFRDAIDRGAAALEPVLSLDIRSLLYPAPDAEEQAAEQLRQTVVTQPVIFVVEYALAGLWKEWGIEPDAMIGHSVGEYTAACLAGVFSFEDAIAVLAARARLMQAQPPGGMLAVRLPHETIASRITEPLALAAANAPSLSVVSGPHPDLDALERALAEEGIQTTRLHTSHAYHSSMMEPVVDTFAHAVADVPRNEPKRTWISSLTGTWITPAQAIDPQYWAQQMRRTVRFSAGIEELLRTPGRIFLEVGPGTTLSTFTQQHLNGRSDSAVVASLGHAQSRQSALDSMRDAAKRLAGEGVHVMNSDTAQSGASAPAGKADTSTTVSNDPIRRLIAAQLDIMRQQIDALRSGSSGNGAQPPLRSVTTQPRARSAAPAPSRTSAASTSAQSAPQKPFGAAARIETRSASTLTPAQQAWLDAFVERYTKKTAASREYTKQHRPSLADPRAVSGFTPVMKRVVYPIVVSRAESSRLTDIDGNEYIDVTSGFGSTFLGHRAPVVVNALNECVAEGYAIGPQHPFAGEVAALMSELTGHERVAFCNTGSEAILGAVRSARTVTGRSTIVMFRDSYHGILDEVVVRGGADLRSMPAAPGIPRTAVAETLVLDYGEPASLDIIRERADSIAAVLVEPVQSRHLALQPREFLHELRAVTADAGIALVIDEIITGFRAALGGAQEHFGVRADIATYGKVVGGGMPIGVIAGSSRFLDALDGGQWSFDDDSVPEVGVTYFAGTFVRHPLALAAARATLQYLKTEGPGLQQALNERTAGCVARLEAVCAELQAPIRFESFSSSFQLYFKETVPFGGLLFTLLRDRGIHIFEGRTWFLTTAHSDADVDAIIEAFRSAVAEMIDNDLLPGRKTPAAPAGFDPSRPPTPDARLGRDPNGNPGWYRPDPDRPGKYIKVSA